MDKLIDLDSVGLSKIDVDAIVKSVEKLEKLINSIETIINEESSNEKFIEGSKVLDINKK